VELETCGSIIIIGIPVIEIIFILIPGSKVKEKETFVKHLSLHP